MRRFGKRLGPGLVFLGWNTSKGPPQHVFIRWVSAWTDWDVAADVAAADLGQWLESRLTLADAADFASLWSGIEELSCAVRSEGSSIVRAHTLGPGLLLYH